MTASSSSVIELVQSTEPHNAGNSKADEYLYIKLFVCESDSRWMTRCPSKAYARRLDRSQAGSGLHCANEVDLAVPKGFGFQILEGLKTRWNGQYVQN